MLDELQPQDTSSVHDASTDGTSSPIPHHLYYRVYTQDGAVQSKHPVYSNDASLGRINANWVAPPHTAASIKRHLSKEEQIADHTCTSLFNNISSPSALADGDIVLILTGTGPGSSPGDPLALVVNPEANPLGTVRSTKKAKLKPDATARRHTISAPAWLSFKKTEKPRTSKAPYIPPPPPSVTSSTHERRDSAKFKCRVRARFDVELSDQNWLSYNKGDILFTDGLKRLSGPNKLEVLLAQSTTGVVGYVYLDDVDII
jgi:hypothetical protein